MSVVPTYTGGTVTTAWADPPIVAYTQPPKLTSFLDLKAVLGPIEFDWNPWLPVGMLTILASEAGVGKSILALRIGASYLTQEPFPDGQPFKGEPGGILWCEAEAAQAINLARAEKWGLPINRIYTPFDDPMLDVCLDNRAHQGKIAEKAILPEVRFIVVDSLSGSSRKREDETAAKTIPEFLARLARDCQKPILLIHHLRKRSLFDGESVTLDRLRGSSAIVQSARVVWALDTPDPDHQDQKRLSMVKNNLTRFAAPIGMTIDENGVKFGEAPKPPHVETQGERAAELIQSLLENEPQPQKLIEETLEEAGISRATLNRVKKSMRIVSVRRREGWYWSLPYEEDK